MTSPHDTGSTASTRDRDGLARVTYLPGVVQPPSPENSAVAHYESHVLQADATISGELKPQQRTKKRAANVSMHALTRRDLSRWELEQALLTRGLEPEDVAEEIARLEGVGLIDDGALAEMIVRTQHERKGLGRGALVAELRRRRVEQHHIDGALERLGVDDELQRARELAERRAPQMMSLDKETAVRRLSGYLLRKGYPSGIVRTVVDEALSGLRATVRFR